MKKLNIKKIGDAINSNITTMYCVIASVCAVLLYQYRLLYLPINILSSCNKKTETAFKILKEKIGHSK